MAKDPAVLWYWNDWLGGTTTLTRHQKGCYMDLLAAQFNAGPLSLDQVKNLLGTDQASWTVLRAKFKREVNSDGIEVFFNERMETERIKRQAFSKIQKDKVNKRWQKDTPVYTPVIPLENENEIRDVVAKKAKWRTMPGAESVNLELPDIKEGAVIELFRLTKNKTITKSHVQSLWKIFKVQNFTGEKYYGSVNEVYSHFINWCKTQTIEPEKKNEFIQQSAPTLKTI